MTRSDDHDILTSGLRALEVLALHGPLDLAAFARLNGLEPIEAGALIAVFEVHGFAERASSDALYAPTSLTMRLVADGRTAGTPWLH